MNDASGPLEKFAKKVNADGHFLALIAPSGD
jgi:hypothetical protein